MLSKFLQFVKRYQYQAFLVFCFTFVSLVSYNLGRISALEKSPLKIGENSDLKTGGGNLKADIYSAIEGQQTNNQPKPTKQLDTRVVVSKNSNKYHYSWCAGAKRIKEENKIWFNSVQEAESGGYALAGNCSP